MISALLLSFFLNITLMAFPQSLPDTWKQYFVFTITCFVIVSIMLFFLSGILCFVSAHHCWFWCVLQRPIQVEPMQTPMASHCPVTDSENKLSADSYPTLRGNRGNCLSSLHFKTSQLHALV
uniref:Uncharacterized protein n=1 Tax=Pipistrellus kuhlii TaxID=59472 RepID=A0A7J7TVZ0_PIPKU|nr:hypothetical protein mPipKuh1_009227 [Pipistrellus kuhlii]